MDSHFSFEISRYTAYVMRKTFFDKIYKPNFLDKPKTNFKRNFSNPMPDNSIPKSGDCPVSFPENRFI